jgi:hypothetical protein
MRVARIAAGFAQRAALPKKIPVPVGLDLNRLEPLILGGVERTLVEQRVPECASTMPIP